MRKLPKRMHSSLAIIAALALILAAIGQGVAPRQALADGPQSGAGSGGVTAVTDVSRLPKASDQQLQAQESAPLGLGMSADQYAQLKERAASTAPSLPLGAAVADVSASAALSAQAPTLGNNFQTIQYTGWIPPDGAMSVCALHVVVAVNSSLAVYNKTGTLLTGPTTFTSFFASLNLPAGTKIFDPRLVYDQSTDHHFLVAAATNSTLQQAWYVIAMSQTGDPTGSWRLWALDSTQNGSNSTPYWADYPMLGIDSQALYITGNMFLWSGGYSQDVKLRIFNKSQFLSGSSSISWYDFWNLKNADGTQAFSLQPAVTFGNPGAEYLLNTQLGTGSYVTLWALTNPLSAAPTLTRQATLTVPGFAIPPNATQPETSTLLHTGDDRMLNVVYKNGSLWAAHNTAVNWASGTYSGIRFYEILPASNTVKQAISYGADGSHYYYPTIMPDNAGNAALVFNRSSASEYVGVRFTGRLSSDPPNSLQGSASLVAGQASYVRMDSSSRNRWGDYSAMALDPNGNTFWMFGEYAASVNQWGTWVGSTSFGAPPPGPTTIRNVYATPNPFNPSAGNTTIRYDLSGTCNNTMAILLNMQQGTTVKTWTLGQQPAGTRTFTWDGATAGGSGVGEGIYAVYVACLDGAQPALGYQFVNVSPVLTNMAITPLPWNAGASSSFQYTLAQGMPAIALILNLQFQPLKIWNWNNSPAGVTTLNWDGKDMAGSTVPAGRYLYAVLAVDVAGAQHVGMEFFDLGSPQPYSPDQAAAMAQLADIMAR
ncbi:MAG: hypothetical protein EPO21_15785 [Chloroflexota bacterium]|nr:MAG: hypothetical protein EPO21_15785 [Chloroflexota bacterium]